MFSVEVPDTEEKVFRDIIEETYEGMVKLGIYEKTWNPDKNKYVYVLTEYGSKLHNQKS
ncbi:MAG: hypothetical protein KGI08_10690 [Thaumarchaeota archaeon]|nr:hypothetical protein [Nitrososphaerota archaeon]